MTYPRVCTLCKTEKSPDCFYRDRRRRRPRCKDCELKIKKTWYYERGGKEVVKTNTKRYRERHNYPGFSDPAKRRARNIAQAAIRRGKIQRKPCERCGKKKVHAHHPDYQKPLDVVFLCDPCHKLEHQAIRAADMGVREEGV